MIVRPFHIPRSVRHALPLSVLLGALMLAPAASARGTWVHCPAPYRQDEYAVGPHFVGCPFGNATEKVLMKSGLSTPGSSVSISVRSHGRSYALRCSLDRIGLDATCRHNGQAWVHVYFDSAQGYFGSAKSPR